jgi:hypothetical protein
MNTCLFCPKPADSLEHVVPQWIHCCVSPQTEGAFPVVVGRYVDGEGYRDKREQISLAFRARIVCEECNKGWMGELESNVAYILKPLVGTSFPVSSHCYVDQLRTNAAVIALWLAKTALTTSFALPGQNKLPKSIAAEIARKQPPHGVWIDVAKATVGGIGAALTRVFSTINGNDFVGPQTHATGACFQFCLQINQLLLRVGMTPGAKVGYIAHGGLIPFRLFPDADTQVPENSEFHDLNHFLHSVVLRTWAGCAGEVPHQIIPNPRSNPPAGGSAQPVLESGHKRRAA